MMVSLQTCIQQYLYLVKTFICNTVYIHNVLINAFNVIKMLIFCLNHKIVNPA